MEGIWDILQIEKTTDRKEIKRAYASRAKEIHPEEDPQAFQMLYQAYQWALRYASSGGAAKEERPPEKERGEENTVSEDQGTVGELDADFAEIRKQWSGLGEIKYFQSCFNRQISFWRQGREFFSEEWKGYLQSGRFQDIMWNSIVMETIAAGMTEYFQAEREILLFFWELYGMDIYEKWGEESFDGESLRALYRSLYPVSKEGLLQKRIEMIAEDFWENWKLQMNVWKRGGGFLRKWKEYLLSESFREIMWSNTVLDTIAKDLKGTFPCREEAALFFWELYGFEKLGEENCKGKSRQLYRTLYPSYVYRLRREEYEKNKDSIVKEENRQIYRMLLIIGAILLVYVALAFAIPKLAMHWRLGMALYCSLCVAF